MEYTKILLTGSSGKLGSVLKNSSLGNKILFAPDRSEMDITRPESVLSYIQDKEIDAIIHCAAFTDLNGCEKDPQKAVDSNILGTSALVNAAIKGKITRFIYISTDYVYPCVKGPYSEKDPTIPFTVYGWTKLGGECAVKVLKNHCIIRTSLFDPSKIVFDTAPHDAYFSKISYSELAAAIELLLNSDFIGTVNVGQPRSSIYDTYRRYRTDIQAKSMKELNLSRAPDSSLDISLWNSIVNSLKN